MLKIAKWLESLSFDAMMGLGLGLGIFVGNTTELAYGLSVQIGLLIIWTLNYWILRYIERTEK